MKKIIFVRHGRAEEPTPLLPDFERSLTPKGKHVSKQIALNLKEKVTDPGIIISSPAFRALETALIFARELGYDPELIILKDDLYFNINVNSFSDMISQLNDEADTVICFGHNPSFTEIPDRLSKEGCDFLPKSGVVCLSFKTDSWSGVVHHKGKREFFLKPEKTI